MLWFKYEGEFRNDIKEGFGIFHLTCGHRYEGEFRNNRSEGYGIIYIPNGDK